MEGLNSEKEQAVFRKSWFRVTDSQGTDKRRESMEGSYSVVCSDTQGQSTGAF